MAVTLREIVFDIGGGVPGGKKLKAVQTGGPAGGCIPESAMDTPVDFDSLLALGSIMGSGGMIIMDEDDCMVDIAKFFLAFSRTNRAASVRPAARHHTNAGDPRANPRPARPDPRISSSSSGSPCW